MSFELPFKLPTGWQVATVDELVKQKIIAKPLDGNHGGIHPKASDYIESGVPFVMASDLAGGRVDLIDCKFISEEQASGLRKGIAKAGDVLLSHKATIGRTAIVQDSKHDFIMLTPQVTYYRVINSSALSNIYLKAYFDSRFFQSILGLWAGAGSTRAYLGITGQLKLPIILPPIEIQNEISGQVHALNKKVNLNNEINQTLEQMAQAIFKSWFVDFDPVKAKINGEQPEGMDAATASLFPDKLVESELGLIPEGWEIKPIKDLCSKVQNGGTPKRSESSYWDDGDIPWLTSGEVRQSIITSVENRITQLGLDKSSAKWVPELSTLVALYGATAGEVSLTSIPLTTNQAVCALMPKKEHQWYNYLQLKSRVAELAGKAVGSAQQNISKGLVESTEVLSVPESLLEAFNAQVENLFKLRICNLQESVELANLRDTLLPKLLSGEIELGETEEMAEVN
ncbi:restriction endonuclease subunit S [Vibrio parahaemolyticus]